MLLAAVFGWLLLTGLGGVNFFPEPPAPKIFFPQLSPPLETRESPTLFHLESQWRTKRLLATSA